jgi:hypothetical protein
MESNCLMVCVQASIAHGTVAGNWGASGSNHKVILLARFHDALNVLCAFSVHTALSDNKHLRQYTTALQF